MGRWNKKNRIERTRLGKKKRIFEHSEKYTTPQELTVLL
jgi:hypothetical protein